MKRMLIVTTVPATLRSFLRPLAEHLRVSGWKVDAMAKGASSCNICVETFDQVWDVDWSRNPIDWRNFLHAVAEVRNIVLNEGYDIVHVHTPVAAFLTRFALRDMRRSGRPVLIYTVHGFHFHSGGSWLKNLIFRAVEKLAGGWTDHLIVINREDEAAAARLGFAAENIHYMPGIGVDTQRYHLSRVRSEDVERVRNEMGIASTDALFLMVAEFNPGKRHADVLRAFKRIVRPGVHLAFAGTGRQLKPLQDLAQSLGIAGQVHFLGFRTDIPELIRASVCTLLPSEREGLPRSVMESLCLEVPVIGSDIRGIRELVSNQNGLLFPVGGIEELATCMNWILNSPGPAREMGRAGHTSMKAYDLGLVLRLHDELYRRVLQS